MHVLVAGWFSWEHMGTTAGDLIARDIVCDWLEEAGIEFEVATDPHFHYPNSIDWDKANSDRYTDIVFVCGPFGNGYPVTDMLDHFSKARLIGVDLSLLETLDKWNPFTLLYERDSSRAVNPDIAFCAPPSKVSVVGVILAHKQKEYGKKGRHDLANEAIEQFIKSREMAVVFIDTSILSNTANLRNEGEIESLIAKMDVVVTTRLHGTVLALKNGVPVIPVDPVAGGAKISLQVKTIGWPILFNPENLNIKSMSEAFEYCLTSKAKEEAKKCADKAVRSLEGIKKKFIREITSLSKGEYLNNG